MFFGHFRDQEGSTPLHRAVQNGHSEVATMLLDRGAPLDVADVRGDTVTHWAVRRGRNTLLATLLRKGANPDMPNKVQECPLHEALRLKNVQGAQLLLRCGASVNMPGPKGVTALMLAAGKPETAKLVETLLDYEADPLAKDKAGKDAIQ